VFYGLEGRAEVLVDGQPLPLEAGGVLAVAPGTVHALRNAGFARVRVLLVQAGGDYDFLAEGPEGPAAPGPS